jgi:hypothetical protein
MVPKRRLGRRFLTSARFVDDVSPVIALNFEQKIADLTRLADELRRINGERGRADRFLKVRPEVLQSAAKPCQPARGHCHVASGLAVQ